MRRAFTWHFKNKGDFDAELEIDEYLLAVYLARKVACRIDKTRSRARATMARGAIKMKFKRREA
jgi:hypothetical protein